MPIIDIRAHGGNYGAGKYRKGALIRYSNLEGVTAPVVLNSVTVNTNTTCLMVNGNYIYAIIPPLKQILKIDLSTLSVLQTINILLTDGTSIDDAFPLFDKTGFFIMKSNFETAVVNLDGTIRWTQPNVGGTTVVRSYSINPVNGDIIYTKDTILKAYNPSDGSVKKTITLQTYINGNTTTVTPDGNYFVEFYVTGSNPYTKYIRLYNLSDGTRKTVTLNTPYTNDYYYGTSFKNSKLAFLGNICYLAMGNVSYVLSIDFSNVANWADQSTISYKNYIGVTNTPFDVICDSTENLVLVTRNSGGLIAFNENLSSIIYTTTFNGGSSHKIFDFYGVKNNFVILLPGGVINKVAHYLKILN